MLHGLFERFRGAQLERQIQLALEQFSDLLTLQRIGDDPPGQREDRGAACGPLPLFTHGVEADVTIRHVARHERDEDQRLYILLLENLPFRGGFVRQIRDSRDNDDLTRGDFFR